MKSAGFVAAVLTVTALAITVQLTGCVSHHSRAASDAPGDGTDLPVREEIRKTYQLAPGALVDIGGINGAVEIETGGTQTAELYLVRSARSQQTLDDNPTTITYEPASLYIHNDHQKRQSLWSLFKGTADLRTRVMLKLPRNVKLTAGGVNGHVTAGEIDGAVEVVGINGKVKLAQVADSTSISGINGAIEVGVRGLGRNGLELTGINGPIQLRFAGDVNADLEVSGLNGGFSDEGLNLQRQEKHDSHNFRARIGTGGPPISLAGINGSVTLASMPSVARSANASPAIQTK